MFYSPMILMFKTSFCCFRHPSPSVLIPALRTVGNIVTGDDLQTQVYQHLDLLRFCLLVLGINKYN